MYVVYYIVLVTFVMLPFIVIPVEFTPESLTLYIAMLLNALVSVFVLQIIEKEHGIARKLDLLISPHRKRTER